MAAKLVPQKIVEFRSAKQIREEGKWETYDWTEWKEIGFSSVEQARDANMVWGTEEWREREINPVIELVRADGSFYEAAYEWPEWTPETATDDYKSFGYLEAGESFRYRPGTEPVEEAKPEVGILSSLPGSETVQSDYVFVDAKDVIDEMADDEDDDEYFAELCNAVDDPYNDAFDSLGDFYADKENTDSVDDFSGISVAVTSEDEIVLHVFDRDEIALSADEAEVLMEKITWALVAYRAASERTPF